MENRPALDRELFIPILIGGLSVVGIVVVLMIGRAMNAPAEVAATPSDTPFQYLYLGTEPAISTAFLEVSQIAPPDGLPTDPLATDAFPPGALHTNPAQALMTSTRGSASTPLVLPTSNVTSTTGVIILQTNTPGLPPTATRTSTASAANTYDDTDSRLNYIGNWVSQSNLPIGPDNTPYQGTLHVSDVADNKSVTINFNGQEIHFFYETAPSFGVVTIYIDNDPLGITVSQGQGNGEWTRMLDEGGSHTVEIAHTSGGSVNIDRFMIPAATPTPTRTPTVTPTQ